jgi:hypothetical protein
MRYETVSLLLNWAELGALLAILFRLAHMFDLIANTQRELRRAIHHLGERRIAELGINDALRGTGIALASGFPRERAGSESTIGPEDVDRLSPAANP